MNNENEKLIVARDLIYKKLCKEMEVDTSEYNDCDMCDALGRMSAVGEVLDMVDDLIKGKAIE